MTWKIVKGNPRKDILELLDLIAKCECYLPPHIEIEDHDIVVEEVIIYPYYRLKGKDWVIYMDVLRRRAKIEGNPDEETIKKLKRFFNFLTKFSIRGSRILPHMLLTTRLPELIEIAVPLIEKGVVDDIRVDFGKIMLEFEEEEDFLFKPKICLRIHVKDIMKITIDIHGKFVELHISPLANEIQKADKPWGSINYYEEYLKHSKDIKEAINFVYKKLLEKMMIDI